MGPIAIGCDDELHAETPRSPQPMLAFVNVAASFSPTRVAYSDLTSTSHELRGILERDGVVAITDVPGFKTAREEALGAASRCVATHPGASSARAEGWLQD